MRLGLGIHIMSLSETLTAVPIEVRLAHAVLKPYSSSISETLPARDSKPHQMFCNSEVLRNATQIVCPLHVGSYP